MENYSWARQKMEIRKPSSFSIAGASKTFWGVYLAFVFQFLVELASMIMIISIYNPWMRPF